MSHSYLFSYVIMSGNCGSIELHDDQLLRISEWSVGHMMALFIVDVQFAHSLRYHGIYLSLLFTTPSDCNNFALALSDTLDGNDRTIVLVGTQNTHKHTPENVFKLGYLDKMLSLGTPLSPLAWKPSSQSSVFISVCNNLLTSRSNLLSSVMTTDHFKTDGDV